MKKHLKLTPKDCVDTATGKRVADAWFYEENRGLTVVAGGKAATIPWADVRASLERKDRK